MLLPKNDALIALTKEFLDSIDESRLDDSEYRKSISEAAAPFAEMWSDEADFVESQKPLLGRMLGF